MAACHTRPAAVTPQGFAPQPFHPDLSLPNAPVEAKIDGKQRPAFPFLWNPTFDLLTVLLTHCRPGAGLGKTLLSTISPNTGHSGPRGLLCRSSSCSAPWQWGPFSRISGLQGRGTHRHTTLSTTGREESQAASSTNVGLVSIRGL